MRRNRRIPVHLLSAFFLVACSGPIFAGGPRDVEGDGTFYRWNPNQPVKFIIDRGSLGSMSNSQGAQMVRDAFQAWANIETAAVTFADQGFISQDINVNNYESYFGFGSSDPPLLSENPIIFDSDGGITNDLFGTGSSNTVLGFAGPRFFDPPNREIIAGWAVLNGKSAGREDFFRVVRHELGHLLGLDHGQGLRQNGDDADDGGPAGLYLPLMYPYMERQGPATPINDDIAWFSWMYPATSFATQNGSIKGKVTRRSGAPFQGANVVAMPAVEAINGSFNPDRKNVVSVVSDFLWEGTGEYELPGLAPGKYLVLIEPLNPAFTGSSGVGPFDIRPTSFPLDYFDENESSEENPNLRTVVEVFAGEVTEGIDIIANEVANRLDQLDDDDEMLFEFPEGFTFPFYGKVYSELIVNSDGNLTFGVGDGKVGEPRTEQRFYSGPPRIAPLFTDLDPGRTTGNGNVESEYDAEQGYIKFTWNGVPEYTDSPPAEPNHFSVTLFSSGDIWFDYQTVGVTPDPDDDYPQGLHSVVGITAGNQSGGVSFDFSASNDYSIDAPSIYQVFPGNSFDLTGRQVRFVAETSEFYFPLLTGDSKHFTGFAITNYSSDDSVATFENLAEDGNLKGGPSNFAIPKDNQLARLGFELFGYSGSSVQDGWVRMSSGNTQLAGFFQIGDAVTRLDGAVAETQLHDVLYFTRLYEGDAVFPTFSGFKKAVTTLALANPNEEAIDITFRLFTPTGNLISSVDETIAAYGSLRKTVTELFGTSVIPVFSGFIEAEVSGPGAVGFEMVELEGTIFGLNAASDHSAEKIYSGQLGHGNGWFTTLKLVNPTGNSAAIGITAFLQENDSINQITKTLTLAPNQSFQESVQAIFGLATLPANTIVGSIQVDSTEPGIVGDVVFGDPETARYAAALPLQTRLFTRAIHSQVSNGIHSTNPGLDSFTGLALFNPNTLRATVTIRVFDYEGEVVGEAEIRLDAKERISQILSVLVPETAGLVRGSVLLISDRPLVAQELFGNADLHYLSAVPPTIIE